MRTEFTNIAAGFTLLPTIAGNAGKTVVVNGGGTALTVSDNALSLAGNFTTTGPFNTTLAQTSTVTLTLPSVDSALATVANVSTETARAIAAEALLAPRVSPTFTGTPAAPTASGGTNTAQIATTAFVATAVAGAAPLASPTFTGTPAAPTASNGTNTTQLATTAFVTNAVAAATTGVSSVNARTGAVVLTLSDIPGAAALASPTFTGDPKAPTASPGDNDTSIATTAFTTAAVAVETSRATTAEALLAPKASPALTGTPTAPTAAPGTNTTQVGTTAFITSAVGVETTRATAAETLLAPLASPTFTGVLTTPLINVTSSVGATVSGWVYNNTGGGSLGGPTGISFGITVSASNGVAGAWYATSDARLKTDVEEITDEAGIAWVKAAKPVSYVKTGKRETGFLAQDQWRAGYAHLIGVTPNEELEELVDGDMTSPAGQQLVLAYDNYHAFETAAIRHLLRRIEELEKRLPA